MSFLDPALLWALPLSGLPILIHLINQRRFQTVSWGAMQFLFEANRMSRGYAWIRQWLILAMRCLAVAALVFAFSRPLASGRLGLAAGGRVDTTIVLLDRSPSMQQRSSGSATTKLERGLDQLASTLRSVGSSRWTLIDSVSLTPQELDSPEALRSAAQCRPAGASADMPALLQAAYDYIQTNRVGQTEIWICSDLRGNDWRGDSSDWGALRDGFLELHQRVRFHVLGYSEPASANVALRVSDVRRQRGPAASEAYVSLLITRTDGSETAQVPIQFEVNGVRTEVVVELRGKEAALDNYALKIDPNEKAGWGRATIPADANSADNEFYFAFSEEEERKSVVVTDQPTLARPLGLAASLSPDSERAWPIETVSVLQVAGLAWERIALVLWHAPLPTDETARAIEAFVEEGGQILFFPPPTPNQQRLFGVGWRQWQTPNPQLAVASWRGDSDLLARTRSGAALPVGELKVTRYCQMDGDATPLANLSGGDPLLARAPSNRGGAYFCATTVANGDSSLASGGVVLYAAIQRALAAGADRLKNARLYGARAANDDFVNWKKLAGDPLVLSSEASAQAGVYALEGRLAAVNRNDHEDRGAPLAPERVDALFEGLAYDRVDDRVDSSSALTREIWRLFFGGVIVALVAEAALCLPKLRLLESRRHVEHLR